MSELSSTYLILPLNPGIITGILAKLTLDNVV